MTSNTNYIRLWRDKALLYFPNIPNRKGRFLRLGIDQLPWSTGEKLPAGTTYRVILGIIPRQITLSAVLSLVLPKWQTSPWVTRGRKKTYIAQFSVDHCGIPHPASAWIHLALTSIKIFEITGHRAPATQYIRTQAEFESKLARHNRPIDDEKLSQLIQWLQGYLPLGCDIMPEIFVDTQTTEETSSILGLIPTTARQSMVSSLHGYVNFLQGSNQHIVGHFRSTLSEIGAAPHKKKKRKNTPRLWPTADNSPLPTDIKELISALPMYIHLNLSKVFILTKHNVAHRTSAACELTALHLIENARFMLTSPKLRIQYIEKWPATFNNNNSMGLTVFSDDAEWLDELQAIFSKSWAADPILSDPPLAQRNPITPRDYLAAISKIEKTELPTRNSIWRRVVDNPLTQRIRKAWRMINGKSAPSLLEEQIKKAFGRIVDRNLESNPPSVKEAIGVLRTYTKYCTPYYRDCAEEYEQLANRLALPLNKRRRLANLYKHLSVITPIRLTTFTEAHVFLRELRGAYLGLAIVDCSGHVTNEQIALICLRFQRVVLIGPERNNLSTLDLPRQVCKALRQKHHIIRAPFKPYPGIDD